MKLADIIWHVGLSARAFERTKQRALFFLRQAKRARERGAAMDASAQMEAARYWGIEARSCWKTLQLTMDLQPEGAKNS